MDLLNDMSSLQELVEAPYSAIDGEFSALPTCRDAVALPDPEAFAANVADKFIEAFGGAAATEHIPLLCHANIASGVIKPNTLVRYIGMVQDMWDPEWFAPVQTRKIPGGIRSMPTVYREAFPFSPDAEYTGGLQLRSSLYCVPIPGESSWARRGHGPVLARAKRTAATTSAENSGQKRKLASTTEIPTGKRLLMEDGNASAANTGAVDGMDLECAPAEPTIIGIATTTTITTTDATDTILTPNIPDNVDGFDMGFPLGASSESELPCLARMYGDSHGLKLCDLVEFVGIYTGKSDIQHDGEATEGEDPFVMDCKPLGCNPPAAVVPRLQCLFFRPLAEDFPVLQPKTSEEVTITTRYASKGSDTKTVTTRPFAFRHALSKPAIEGGELEADNASREAIQHAAQQAVQQTAASQLGSSGMDIPVIRREIIDYLSGVLGGDALAAEYLLFFLLSKVTKRLPSRLLGKLNIAIQGFPEEPALKPSLADARPSAPGGGTPSPLKVAAGATMDGASHAVSMVQKALAEIMPRTAVLPLSVKNLNSITLCPTKDPDTDRLSPGVLQLASGTCLIIDSTVLGTGELNEKGLAQLRDVQQLVSAQTLAYKFPFSELAFPADIPVLLLNSAGSVIRGDLVVALADDARPGLLRLAAEGAVSEPSDGFFERARGFLAYARNAPYTLPDEVKDIVTANMDDARKLDRSIIEEDLHRWLAIAKLLTISHGEMHLSSERWREARDLESQRTARLSKASTTAGSRPLASATS